MAKTTYDAVVYESSPHLQGNIRNLETIADLFSLNPTDIRRCRVLELGAATGTTLIPQADEFPNSEFIGIDLSSAQIQAGVRTIAELGLKNIELRCANIMDVGPDWGKFDYIVVHGIYSWVPPFVADKILAICGENLSDDGVAMVSFNTYPGWHAKEIVRDLMLFETKEVRSAKTWEEEVGHARKIVETFAEMKSIQARHTARMLRPQHEHLKNQAGYYIFHEYLEEYNNPCYFIDFHRRLREKNLEFLSDYFWTENNRLLLEPEIADFASKVGNRIHLEQYFDFLINRTFRSTLICRDGAAKRIVRRENLTDRYTLHLSPGVSFLEELDGHWTLQKGPGRIDVRKTPFGNAIVSWLRRNKQAYFGSNTMWTELLEKATQNVVATYSQENLISTLEKMIDYGIVSPVLRPAEIGDRTTERPRVSRYVRHLARQQKSSLPTPEFSFTPISPLLWHVLPKLDGRHTVSELVDQITDDIRRDRLLLKNEDKLAATSDREAVTAFLADVVEGLYREHLLLP